jgi:antagonist of KipI
MAVHVIKPGMLTTVQDLGRWGYQALGVPVAGPMDSCSHRLANAMVGNLANAATLEVTLVGPELEFEDECLVAVAGAQFEATLDGRSVPLAEPLIVSRGSTLRFGRRLRGTRAYVAISGGISTPLTLGSRATHLISTMGGVEGRALQAGDRLPLGGAVGDGLKTVRYRPKKGMAPFPLPDGHTSLRVLPGPQAEYFTPEALNALQSAPYRVATNSDRMGFRLEGPPLTHARSADIISDATALGALQVPASGRPILLMADRQTTGGYPKIATVITADISSAGQLGPGDTISFALCSEREALSALIAQERALMAIEPQW